MYVMPHVVLSVLLPPTLPLLSACSLGFRALSGLWITSSTSPHKVAEKGPSWGSSPPFTFEMEIRLRECFLARRKQEALVMPKSVHSLTSTAGRHALGTPGSLNKARLWQWEEESTPEDMRQTTHLTLWLSCRGILLLVCLSGAVFFLFLSVCIKPPIMLHVNDAREVLVIN